MIHPLTYDGLDLLRAVLLVHGGVLFLVLLVSQHRKRSCSCSSTAGGLHSLGAGGRAGVELGRAAIRQAWDGGKVGRNRSRASGEARRLGEEGEGEGEGGL